jgi:hypothetical protein
MDMFLEELGARWVRFCNFLFEGHVLALGGGRRRWDERCSEDHPPGFVSQVFVCRMYFFPLMAFGRLVDEPLQFSRAVIQTMTPTRAISSNEKDRESIQLSKNRGSDLPLLSHDTPGWLVFFQAWTCKLL